MKPLNVEYEMCVVEGLPNTVKIELDQVDQNRKQVNKVLIYFADLVSLSIVGCLFAICVAGTRNSESASTIIGK